MKEVEGRRKEKGVDGGRRERSRRGEKGKEKKWRAVEEKERSQKKSKRSKEKKKGGGCFLGLIVVVERMKTEWRKRKG